MAALDRTAVRKAFLDCVNMTAPELRRWLRTAESKSVGWKGSDGAAAESVGHASGRKIAKILATPETDLSDGDYAHMRKAVGFIRRHSAQRPENIYTSRWRYSLMNWGHDPVKEDR